jgi:hypothetical protein
VRVSRFSGRSTGYGSQRELRDTLSLASNDKALRFLNAMVPEQTHIATLLQRLELHLLDGGRKDAGEKVGLVAARLSRAQDLDTALQMLYGVRGWDGLALKLMWYVEQMRQAGVGTAPNEDLMRHRMGELAETLSIPDQDRGDTDQALSGTIGLDLREALIRFGSHLEELREASFAGGSFSGLSQFLMERAVEEAASLRMIATAQRSRDVARFAKAFAFFASHVLEHSILQDVRVLHLIGTANLTLQTVLETAEAEDFDSLYQTIALLESPRTLLQSQ